MLELPPAPLTTVPAGPQDIPRSCESCRHHLAVVSVGWSVEDPFWVCSSCAPAKVLVATG